MAGRFDLARLLILALGLSTFATASATGEPVRGRSQDLGIDFEFAGGSSWCADRVAVRLSSLKADAFKPDTIPFLQMIGRIRAIAATECDTIELLSFEGRTGGRTVFAAETSRLTRWRRFIILDPKLKRPVCPTAATNECDALVESYLLARTLMRGARFADVEITSLLEAGSDVHLAWRANEAIGKLRIVRIVDLPEFATTEQFADAIAKDIGEACLADGGQEPQRRSLEYNERLSSRMIACQSPSQTVEQNILVTLADRQFHVFSIWSDAPDSRAAAAMTLSLISAIQSAAPPPSARAPAPRRQRAQ